MLALPILDDQHRDLLDRQAAFFGSSATMSGLAWQLTLTFEGLQEVGLVSLDDILQFGIVFAGWKRQHPGGVSRMRWCDPLQTPEQPYVLQGLPH
ncbi:hypothetical protein AO268_25965 [Pseudomonas sp. ICMP 8385]|jgi:hypothetical protein|nr:hypothetical protein BZY59_31155 [Pseudomonas aeruginosa]PHN52819.1 hypothetical protein AO268_25965 [Pseudomonas sp. ICMP 8385]